MSDYTKSYNGAAKDAAEDIVLGADFDTEFEAIETAIASKANKQIPVAVGNVATLSSSGDLQDSGVTSTELAILDGATVTTAELNTLDGITATTAELNTLDGITATVTELNYTDGVTSAIQTQLDSKITSPATQSDIGSSAVGQGQLKTAAATNSTTAAHSRQTLSSGQYGFVHQVRASSAGSDEWVSMLGASPVTSASSPSYTSFTVGTSDLTRAILGQSSGNTIYLVQRYIQASPPYDLGDGEIPLFVFAEVDSNGDVVSVAAAPEAPWHYNGPTNIKADYYRNGKGYQKRKDSEEIDASMVAAGHTKGFTMASAKAAGASVFTDYLNAFTSAPVIEKEVTQAVKNSDMDIVPSPIDPQTGNTVILLDPVADICNNMAEMLQHDGFNLNELLHNKDIIIDNTKLNRTTPNGVDAYSWRVR
jgi:hypothetical protein